MSIATPSKTKEILRKYDIRLTKRLGQHFLVDRNILEKEIKAAELKPDDKVLEIGPGIGTLTVELAPKVCRVVAVEMDKRFISILSETLATFQNVDIVKGDALSIDIGTILSGPAKLVSNLPYNVATPVIRRILEIYPQIGLLVVMVQKEIANRLAAKPGEKDYGVLAVKTQFYADVEQVAHVSRNVFIPEPDVDSTIVRIKRLPKPRVQVRDENSFFRLIKEVFGQRRKTLRTVLVASSLYSKTAISKAFSTLAEEGIDPSARADTLTLPQLALLYNTLTLS